MGVFRPYIILSRYFAYEKVIAVQALLVGMMAVITIILSGCMIYMRRRVLKPIKTFSENLTRLEETDAGLDLKDTVRCYSLAMASAAGFYQSVVGFFCVLGANLVVKKLSPENAMF